MGKGVSVQMDELLSEVTDRVKGVMKSNVKQTARDTAKKLRDTSPRKTGDYSRGWRATSQKGGDYVVHNATEYRLTHLLEKGHVIRNKKGTYGRTRPIKHIEPAEEWAAEELPRRIMEDLNNL